MPNDSATGGYLVPSSSAPLNDGTLEDALAAFVVGITGLPGKMVRPRWQPTVPQMPPVSTDWCAVGVMRQMSTDYPAIQHDGSGQGQDTLTRHQELEVLASFYGPNAMQYAGLLSDGAYVPQNSEGINAQDIKIIECQEARAAPLLVNQQWQRRYDVALKFRRVIRRTYPVLNIVSAEADLTSDAGPSTTATVP